MIEVGDSSIRRKLLLTVVLTAGISLLLACAAFIAHDLLTLRSGMARRVETLADILGIHTAAALAFNDDKAAEETLAALGAEHDVIAACVWTKDGMPFARYSREAGGDVCAVAPTGDGHVFDEAGLDLDHQIVADGENLGVIRIRWDTREVSERTESYLVIVLVLFVASGAVGLIAASRLQRSISVPLAALVRGSESLAQGDLSVKVRAEGGGELTVLANAFNAMALSLRGLIWQVTENIRAVAGASDVLKRTGERMGEHSRRQEVAVEDTAESVSRVSRSIDDVNEHVSRLAESAGETSSSMVEMDASIGEVAGHMDNLASSIEVTSSSIVELTASIREIAENVEGLDRATHTTVSSLQELHSSVSRVEGNAERSHELTQAAAQEAERGSRSVEQTIGAMREIRASFASLREVIDVLARKSEAIGEIVRVIEGVAEETNLLSLNAAIIASQAGEHGKAFSVVAGSVKNLAERTARSTREIASLVQSVQAETGKAVRAMGENGERVETGVSLSNEAGEALRRIMESAEQSARWVREIVDASKDQSRDLEQVDSAMAQMRDIVAQIDRSIREQKNASGEITHSVEQIRVLGQEVKRSTEEQSRGSKLITTAMDRVTTMIDEIVRAMNEQSKGSEQIRGALQVFREVTLESAQRSQELAATVSDLSARSEQLESEIGRFKL